MGQVRALMMPAPGTKDMIINEMCVCVGKETCLFSTARRGLVSDNLCKLPRVGVSYRDHTALTLVGIRHTRLMNDRDLVTVSTIGTS